jgi:hypothetical protein
VRLAGSEVLARTYSNTGVERRVKKNGLETHAIQVPDEPRQIPASQAWNNVLMLVPAKEVVELLVKLG